MSVPRWHIGTGTLEDYLVFHTYDIFKYDAQLHDLLVKASQLCVNKSARHTLLEKTRVT